MTPKAPEGARRRTFSYRGFRFEKAQAGWDVWRGTKRVGWVTIRDHAKPFVDELLESERSAKEAPGSSSV
jgi:hypothetical protein